MLIYQRVPKGAIFEAGDTLYPRPIILEPSIRSFFGGSIRIDESEFWSEIFLAKGGKGN